MTDYAIRKIILGSIAILLCHNSSPCLATTNTQSQQRYESLETFAKTLFYLESVYIDEDKVKPHVLINSAIEGMVSQLDPHTVLMPKQAFEQLTIDTKGKFGGVGIIVSQENAKVIVVSPIEGTPAYKAGILSGDEIVAIDDKDLSTMKNSEAMELMRGTPGSKIKITIKRKGSEKNLDFSLIREIIQVASARGFELDDGIPYLRVASFQENTTDELQKLLTNRKTKIRGAVLDLRDNPGGLLDQAVKIVDLFIPSGLIVSTVGRDPDRIEREFAHKKDTFSDFPMIVLVNEGSASASEIVAGALQDHQRALILGKKTFGKGSVQTLVSLPDGSGLKITIARYYTPKDRSIQAKGIVPDIIVPMMPDSSKAPAVKREADLSGHIEAQDLSDMAKSGTVLSVVEKWPKPLRDDHQLTTAFTYLKTFSLFKLEKTPPAP